MVFVCFFFGLVCFLMGLLTGLCIGPLPALEAIDDYESTPVCAKPSYWMRRDDGEFIHEFTWKWTAYIE